MRVDPQSRFGERECPSCACRVAANENRCPVCGYEFPALPRRRAIALAGAVLMLALLALFVGRGC